MPDSGRLENAAIGHQQSFRFFLHTSH